MDMGEESAGEKAQGFLSTHPTVWSSWVARKQDKEVEVRIRWVTAIPGLMVRLAQGQSLGEEEDGVEGKAIQDLLQGWEERLVDPDERVRRSASTLPVHLPFSIHTQWISSGILKHLALRAKDRKETVRQAATQSLIHIYQGAYPLLKAMAEEGEINSGRMDDPGSIERFSRIPNDLLHLSFVGEASILGLVEKAIGKGGIFTHGSTKAGQDGEGEEEEVVVEGQEERVDHYLITCSFMDQRGMQAMSAAFARKARLRHALHDLLEHAMDDGGMKGDELPNDRQKVLLKLITTMPCWGDGSAVLWWLERLVQLGDKTLVQLLHDSLQLSHSSFTLSEKGLQGRRADLYRRSQRLLSPGKDQRALDAILTSASLQGDVFPGPRDVPYLNRQCQMIEDNPRVGEAAYHTLIHLSLFLPETLYSHCEAVQRLALSSLRPLVALKGTVMDGKVKSMCIFFLLGWKPFA